MRPHRVTWHVIEFRSWSRPQSIVRATDIGQHETIDGQGRTVAEDYVVHPATGLVGSHTQSVDGTACPECNSLIRQSAYQADNKVR